MAQKSAKFEAKQDDDGPQEKEQERNDQSPQEIAQRKIAKPKEEAKETDSPQKKSNTKQGLFSNLSQATPAPLQQSLLFNNTNISTPQGNVGTNLFQSSGLFGKATTGLFGQTLTGGLFGNTSNLFSNQPKTSESVAPLGGLFSINFSNASRKEDEDEDGDDGEDDAASNKSDDEPKEIIMKHDYQKSTNQLLKNTNDVLEKGTIALEEVIDSKQHLIIYRNQINNILYSGYVYPGISTVANLNNKEENLIVKLISLQENHKDSKKFNKDTIKLMVDYQKKNVFYKFSSGEEANKFKLSLLDLCEKKPEDKNQESNKKPQ